MVFDPITSPRLTCERVTKLFGSAVALWQVDLEVTVGEFALVHGPNGSGKSTLLRILAGLTSPSAGHVRWDAFERTAPRIVRVGHRSGLYDALTPMDHFELFARLGWTNADHALEIFAGLGASHVLGRPCGGLSAGTRRRVALARAFASRGDVVLLDEPLASLDERGATGVVDLIKETADRGALVIAAAPSDPRLWAIAHRAITLNQGRALRPLAPAQAGSATDAI